MFAKPPRAAVFPLVALFWSLGLFGLLRSSWVEAHVLLPLTVLQKQAADHYVGGGTAPVVVTLECSGADVLALCLAAILAFPVPWRARLTGAAGAVVFVLALNTVRIATLGRVAASPALFAALHLQVWPAILVLATAGYVFAWMRTALGRTGEGEADRGPLTRRFALRAAVLLAAFALAGPALAQSEALQHAGVWTAGTAAFLLTAVGLGAAASGNVLTTSRGAFMVTPECLATALIPLYAAGVLAARVSWPRRTLALLAGPPLFALLAVARLLLLALPPAFAASPLFLVHGFHQLVLAVVAVLLLAFWREPRAPHRFARAAGRAGAALGGAAMFAVAAGALLAAALQGAARAVAVVIPATLTDLTAPGDTQGALAVLPAYQACLLLALGLAAFPGWQRFLSAFGLLLASQVFLLMLLGAMTAEAGLGPHALLLRAWAVAVPIVLALALWRAAWRPLGMLAPVDGPR